MGVANVKATPARMGRLQSSIPVDFTIYYDGSVYRAESCLVGVDDISNANKTTVQQAAVNALASGGIIYLKGITLSATVTYGNSILIVEDYQGKRRTYSNLGKNLPYPLLAADPSTVGWGSSEKGYGWFNTSDGKYKYWNGAAVISYPVTGGAGAPTDASYITINTEAGLDAETLHSAIVDEAYMHGSLLYDYVNYVSGGIVYGRAIRAGLSNLSNADAYVVLKAEYDALGLNGGSIFNRIGTYPMSQDLIIDGDLYQGISLVGQHWKYTFLKPASGYNAVTFQDGATYCNVINMGLDMTTVGSLYGIKGIGHNTGAWDDDISLDFGILERIYIKGVQAGQWAIHIQNFDHVTYRDIFGQNITGAGGMFLENTSTSHLFGDNQLEGEILFTNLADNSIGFKFQGNSTKIGLNLSCPGRLFADGGDKTGSKGYHFNYFGYAKLMDMVFENVETGMDFDYSREIGVSGKHYQNINGTSGSFFNLDANSFGNDFLGLQIGAETDQKIVIDAYPNRNWRNSFKNFNLVGTTPAWTLNTITGYTEISGWRPIDNAYILLSENEGYKIFSPNGSDVAFTIPHYLHRTPRNVQANAWGNPTSGVKKVAADATNITVTFDSAPPAGASSLGISWLAYI